MKQAGLFALVMGGCAGTPAPESGSETPSQTTVRVATFNVSMYREEGGALARDLADASHEQARLAAAILQEVRPDVVLLNEFDYDASGAALDAFAASFLGVSQEGREAIDYPYRYIAPVNTGISSGFDFDNDGATTTDPGSRAYAGDCYGYGVHPGQYGMAILSRYPLGETRTFQQFLWKDQPDADLPAGWYSEDELAVFRLSSKSHWDVTVQVGEQRFQLLASHPTPPGFDGSEDRNGKRNAAEIRFWTDYIAGADYPVDDAGTAGGLSTNAAFVIVGDLNADPNDGETSAAIRALLTSERVAQVPAPRSEGGEEQAVAQGGANATQTGPAAEDTADFSDTSVGNLRVDYALPSSTLDVKDSGVFWPSSADPTFPWVGTYPFPVSDHRLVWVDISL